MSLPVLDSLVLWWGQHPVGVLSIDKGGAMHFTYGADWLANASALPVSQALPKRTEPYDDALCKAVFGGLLPEEAQRIAVARALGISPDNPFRLLAALGGDVAGALSFLKEGEKPPIFDHKTPPSDPLDDAALLTLFERLPRAPMLAGEEGIRLSLAGAQSKLPVILSGDSIRVPRAGEISTHLIKPEPLHFRGLAANEAYCLALARTVGLDAVFAEWRTAGNRPYLLVTRYDRKRSDDGDTERLHQEDFAQALGVPPQRKYAGDGGPVFADCFALLRRAVTRPASEVLKLADAALFNLIIGNADAHAKNFSLLCSDNGHVQLAPLYDLVATHAWPELAPKLAMRFGKAATLEEVDKATFALFAAEAKLGAPYVRIRAAELADKISFAIAGGLEVPGLEDMRKVEDLAASIGNRAERLRIKAGG